MLNYFFKYAGIKEIADVKQKINTIKKKIIEKEYPASMFCDENYNKIFIHIKKIAIDLNDEQLANAQYVAREYYELFLNIYKYFHLLCNGSYADSWSVLQGCIELAESVSKYTSITYRRDIPDILKMLRSYELLYPYKIFCSSEMAIIESECSICGKSMLDFECTHIKGRLYWGEPAYEIVKDASLQAVAIVSNPIDKRCIALLPNDLRTEKEKFMLLDHFVSNFDEFLISFKVKEEVILKENEEVKNIGRNERCPCGSGKKFKKCCGWDIYYEHIHYTIEFIDTIALELF